MECSVCLCSAPFVYVVLHLLYIRYGAQMIGGGARSSRACPVIGQQHVFFFLWFWTVDSGMMATGPANPNIQALSSALAVVIAQHASPPSTQPSGATTQPSGPYTERRQH